MASISSPSTTEILASRSACEIVGDVRHEVSAGRAVHGGCRDADKGVRSTEGLVTSACPR